jgi:hypothetical protein
LKIKCLHGFFIFEESRAGEISDFIQLVQFDLVPWENHFTFADLVAAPEYSLVGKSYLGTPAVATYAGRPWEVMEANGFVYNFNSGLLVPIDSITSLVTISQAGNHFVSPGLIMPGSITDDGSRVKDYAAWFSVENFRFKYSEVTFV